MTSFARNARRKDSDTVVENFVSERSSLERLDKTVIYQIISYLSVPELTALGLSSSYFLDIGSASLIWNNLLANNFHSEVNPFSTSVSRFDSTDPACGKARYLERYGNYLECVKHGKALDVESQVEIAHTLRIRFVENLLDFTQVRMMIPLILAGVILTIVLFAQKVDGLGISYWACFVPLLIALLYLVFSFCILKMLHRFEQSPRQIMRDMWANFRGPVVFVYQEILGAHLRLVYAALALLAVFVLQVLLVATKLSSSTPPELRDHYLLWPVVFIPIWLCLILYCALPVFVRNIDVGAFLSLLCLLVVPTLIFFVCLTVKLAGAEDNAPQRRIRLALMLIPFWILEGVFMLGSLLFLLIGIYRYRRGLERLWEYMAVFLVTWGSLLPFVLFQALLCARDDYQYDYYGHGRRHAGPSATETVAPLLILLGWLCITASAVSFTMKTAYQEARDRVLHDAANLRIMYQF